MAIASIQYDYALLTRGVMGVGILVYDLLSQSNTTDDMIVENTVSNPMFTIEELNKFYIKCVNGHLTGSKLWIAYKFSNKNLNTLLDNVKTWNKDMVEAVNKQCVVGQVQDPEIKIPYENPADDNPSFKLFH